MRLLLLLACLLVATAVSQATVQKYILTTGGANYVTITVVGQPAQDYTRGIIGTTFNITSAGDTQMSIGYVVPPLYGITPYTADTNYQNGDAANGNFPNADSLYRWTRRHLQK